MVLPGKGLQTGFRIAVPFTVHAIARNTYSHLWVCSLSRNTLWDLILRKFISVKSKYTSSIVFLKWTYYIFLHLFSFQSAQTMTALLNSLLSSIHPRCLVIQSLFPIVLFLKPLHETFISGTAVWERDWRLNITWMFFTITIFFPALTGNNLSEMKLANFSLFTLSTTSFAYVCWDWLGRSYLSPQQPIRCCALHLWPEQHWCHTHVPAAAEQCWHGIKAPSPIPPPSPQRPVG